MDILTRGLVWEGDGKIVKRPKKKGTCLVIGGASFIYAYGKDYSMEMGEARVVGWGCFFLFEWGKERKWLKAPKLSYSPVCVCVVELDLFKFFSSGCAKRIQKD